MVNNHRRRMEIKDAVHEIENHESTGAKQPGAIVRNRIKSLFNTGELAVLVYLVENDHASMTDIPSAVAARELVRLEMATTTRHMAQSPVSGAFLTKRVELTEAGQTLANFIYPNTTLRKERGLI